MRTKEKVRHESPSSVIRTNHQTGRAGVGDRKITGRNKSAQITKTDLSVSSFPVLSIAPSAIKEYHYLEAQSLLNSGISYNDAARLVKNIYKSVKSDSLFKQTIGTKDFDENTSVFKVLGILWEFLRERINPEDAVFVSNIGYDHNNTIFAYQNIEMEDVWAALPFAELFDYVKRLKRPKYTKLFLEIIAYTMRINHLDDWYGQHARIQQDYIEIQCDDMNEDQGEVKEIQKHTDDYFKNKEMLYWENQLNKSMKLRPITVIEKIINTKERNPSVELVALIRFLKSGIELIKTNLPIGMFVNEDDMDSGNGTFTPGENYMWIWDFENEFFDQQIQEYVNKFIGNCDGAIFFTKIELTAEVLLNPPSKHEFYSKVHNHFSDGFLILDLLRKQFLDKWNARYPNLIKKFKEEDLSKYPNLL